MPYKPGSRSIFSHHISTASCRVELDFDQGIVTNALLAEKGVDQGMWPPVFNGTKMILTERERESGTSWEVTLKNIKEVTKNEFKADMNKDIPDYTYVMVYDYKANESHCVFAQKLTVERHGLELVNCINSHDTVDAYPRIRFDKADLKFFSVSCEAKALIG